MRSLTSRWIAVFVIGLSLAILPVAAEELDALAPALAAYERSDFATASRLFRLEAEHGDPTAQSYLGAMYMEGQGVVRDPQEGVRWFTAAARQGDAEAMFGLGLAYQQGNGVAKDSIEARTWYEMAIEAGSPEAAFKLAAMMREGEGGPASAARALELLEEAAIGGVPEAAHEAGSMILATPSPATRIDGVGWLIAADDLGDDDVGPELEAWRTKLTPEEWERADAFADRVRH